MTLVQWISGRLAAQSIRTVVRAGRALFGVQPATDEEAAAFLVHSETVSIGLSPRGSEAAIATVQAIKAYVNTLAQG